MSTSIGQQLREARQAKGLSLEQIYRTTHIRPRHLEAIEAGNLEALPSLTQARGFLRAYALHLGLDPDPLIDRLPADVKAQAALEPAPAPPVDPYTQDLYLDIGDALVVQREMLGVSLDEAEKQTRLRRHHLEALERGDFKEMPSPVQARGMLKNYAAFLGLDPDPLLLKFAEALQAELAGRRPVEEERPNRVRRPGLRRFISGDLLFGSIFLLGLIIFVIWAVGRVSATQASQQAGATAPAIIDVLDPQSSGTPAPTLEPTFEAALLTATPSGSGLEATPTPVPTQPITNDAPVQVYIVVTERTWMRVTVDGAVEFEGRVIPGSAYPFSGREEIQVLVASGSALEIFFNQQNQGPLGLFGQIVERIYTPGGVLIPTPEESPTPMPTETPSITETPAPTSLP